METEAQGTIQMETEAQRTIQMETEANGPIRWIPRPQMSKNDRKVPTSTVVCRTVCACVGE